MSDYAVYKENPESMYKDANDIQDASNIIAVVGVLREMLIATNRDTNNAAVIALYDKISSLMGLQSDSSDKIFKAHSECSRRAKDYGNLSE